MFAKSVDSVEEAIYECQYIMYENFSCKKTEFLIQIIAYVHKQWQALTESV